MPIRVYGISTPYRPIHLATHMEEPWTTLCGQRLGSEKRPVEVYAAEEVTCRMCLKIHKYRLVPGEENPDLKEEGDIFCTAQLPIWTTTHYVDRQIVDPATKKVAYYITRCGRQVESTIRLFRGQEATCLKCRGEAGQYIALGMAESRAGRKYNPRKERD